LHPVKAPPIIRRHLSTVAAATAAVMALGFAPAPAALDVARPAPGSATTTARHLTGVPTSNLGVMIRADEGGTVDRASFERGLAGMADGTSMLDRRARRDGLRTLLEDGGAQALAPALCRDGCGGEEGESGVEEPWEPESYSYSYTDVYPIADVDGDGTDDLARVSYEYSYDTDTDTETERSDVAALAGSDGAQLWSLDGVSGYLAVTPDVDGDGLADLAAVEFDYEGSFSEECTPDGCTFSSEFRDVMTFSFLRGRDGAALGSTEVESTFGYTESEANSGNGVTFDEGYSYRYYDTGLITELAFVGTGTDARLLVGTISLEDSYSYASSGVDLVVTDISTVDAEERFAVDSAVRVVDPRTGAATSLADSATDGKISLPRATGDDSILVTRFDAVDDQRASSCPHVAGVAGCDGEVSLDDITDEPMQPERDATIAMLELDGTERWEMPAHELSFVVVPARGDLDGDGVGDLLDLAYDEDYNDIVIAISGADGTDLWTSEFMYGRAIGDTVVGVAVRYEDDTVELDAVTVDASTGVILARRMLTVLFEQSDEQPNDGTTDEPTEGDSFVMTFVGVDWVSLDGDGLDLLVERFVIEFAFVGEFCETSEDEETGDTYEYCYYEYEGTVVEADVAGYDGATLDSVFIRDAIDAYLIAAVDLEGDGPVELLLGSYDEATETYAITAERLDGSTLWTLSPEVDLVGVLRRADGGADIVIHDWMAETTDVRDGVSLAVRFSVSSMPQQVGIAWVTR
jgi:hypothetical protein